MIDGKKEFLKKLCFVLRRRMLCIFRVEYNKRQVGIKLNGHLGFSRPYKKGKVFFTSADLEGTPIPILDKFFF